MNAYQIADECDFDPTLIAFEMNKIINGNRVNFLNYSKIKDLYNYINRCAIERVKLKSGASGGTDNIIKGIFGELAVCLLISDQPYLLLKEWYPTTCKNFNGDNTAKDIKREWLEIPYNIEVKTTSGNKIIIDNKFINAARKINDGVLIAVREYKKYLYEIYGFIHYKNIIKYYDKHNNSISLDTFKAVDELYVANDMYTDICNLNVIRELIK